MGLSAQCHSKQNSVILKKGRNVGTYTLFYTAENSRSEKLNLAIAVIY